MKKILFFFGLIILLTNLSVAQNEQLIEVYGKVISADNLKPVPYIFVLNVSRHLGTKTDTSGKFRIIMTIQDSLRIYGLGYETVHWKPAAKDVKHNRINTVIYIPQKNYKIAKVDVYGERWKGFVQDVANTEIKQDETQERIIIWIGKILENENLKTLANLSRGSGVVIPLPTRTKRERELRKLNKLQQQEALQREIDKKFNKELVADITGLQGEELDNFMKRYCNFDRKFILETSEYDLIMIIKDMYAEYVQMNKKK